MSNQIFGRKKVIAMILAVAVSVAAGIFSILRG